ncbi:hypothetical protein GWI33_016625 [Rhynchophorus ferrugineus]|uniref:Regulator of telomere elongation helicase 1 homolog n=1 Tax=Rhynchophorus ferrugineus TaxID=354439 RepID=A0A834M6X7_RHYFE|nr:hypothetical protein GWI33_016625 [Rhynchophorus ferrugineus]
MAVEINIRGVPIQFPFTPYDIQKDYMEKVIECLQNESTAILESPTGTGKTLCLLCSSLAWLELKKTQLELLMEMDGSAGKQPTSQLDLKLPTVIFASRTHSQLTQAMQELKKSSYKYMRACVLASRDQLCIHPEVMSEQDKDIRSQKCILKVRKSSCDFYDGINRFLNNNINLTDTSIFDIEDMLKLGNKHTICPYYMTKELQRTVNIIFMPYNYLLNPLVQRAFCLNLANSVVILDEAHNVEKVCEESASIELKSSDITLAVDEVNVVIKLLVEESISLKMCLGDTNLDKVANFQEILLKLEKFLNEIPLNGTEDVTHFSGDYIFDILEKAGISSQNSNMILQLINKITPFVTTKKASGGKALLFFSDFLTIIFRSGASKEKLKSCFKVHIKEENSGKGNNLLSNSLRNSDPSKGRILSFWCFSPRFGMELILRNNIKALILTSGTLAPLKPFISELELDVSVSLENPHIVSPNQICVNVLSKGPDGVALNCNFQNRDNSQYLNSLGITIVNLSRIVPDGLLIFFPSYYVMNKCESTWQEGGIWTSISNNKAIFVEPREKDAFNAAMNGYYERIKDPAHRGAIFMAVCKGKVSEGLDFSDANGRTVIIIGLPYPPLKEPRVILKMDYLNQCHSKDKEYITGQDWYNLEASRAVNQAVGRVIRHRHDFGAILFLDMRFRSFKIRCQMPKWLQGHIKCASKFSDVVRDLTQFFKRAHEQFPVSNGKLAYATSSTFDSTATTSTTFDLQTYNNDNSNSGPSSVSLTVQPPNAYPGTSGYSDGNSEDKNRIDGLVTIHNNKRCKEDNTEDQSNQTKKALTLNNLTDQEQAADPKSMTEFFTMVKNKLGPNFREFAVAIQTYRSSNDINNFLEKVDPLVPSNFRYIFIGMDKYIRRIHQETYREFLQRNNLTVPENL